MREKRRGINIIIDKKLKMNKNHRYYMKRLRKICSFLVCNALKIDIETLFSKI